MKRLLTIAALSAGLVPGPVFADRGNTEVGLSLFVSPGQTIAHNYYGREHPRWHRPRHHERYESDRFRKPKLHPINETFAAKTTSNVRAGPSVRFFVTDRLHRHERVYVIGRVKGRNWYMVRHQGRRGFVYAPLLRPVYFGYRGYWDDDRWSYRRRSDR